MKNSELSKVMWTLPVIIAGIGLAFDYAPGLGIGVAFPELAHNRLYKVGRYNE